MHKPNHSGKTPPGIRQISKFFVVGCSNFAVSFFVFYYLYKYGKLSGVFYGVFGQSGQDLEHFMLQLDAASLDASLANVFGYTAGITNSFVRNRLWTFHARQSNVEIALSFDPCQGLSTGPGQ